MLDHHRPAADSRSVTPGKFHGEFTEILLDEIQVFREYTGPALRQSCSAGLAKLFWFGIPETRGEQGFIGAQGLGSAEIATRPGGTERTSSTPDDYTILGVVISKMLFPVKIRFCITRKGCFTALRNQLALEVKSSIKRR